MSIICSTCGKDLPDGTKFCGNCGSAVVSKPASTGFCPNCGSTLKPGAKFCNICGTKLQNNEPVQQESPAETEQPTMDSLVPPVITDATFANQQASVKPEDNPSFEAIETPAAQPISQTVPVSQPTQEELSAAAQSDSFTAPTPTVSETPVINDTYYSQPKPQTQQPQVQPQNYNAAPNSAPVYNNPQQYTPPQMDGVTPGKGAGAIVPIILIILILAVIAVDIFVLFPDRIFGKDDDSSAKEEISIVMQTDDIL